MILNEVLTKQSFITNVLFSDEDSKLSKDLRIKIMKIRIEYNRIKDNFEKELQMYKNSTLTPELDSLLNKENRTSDEEELLNELVNGANSKINEFAREKGVEEVDVNVNDIISESEFEEIISVNLDNNVEINGTKLSPAEFLEGLYALFVK